MYLWSNWALKKERNGIDKRHWSQKLIETVLKQTLTNFPWFNVKYKALCTFFLAVWTSNTSMKKITAYPSLLAYSDFSSCVNQDVAKIPCNIRKKWIDRATKYKNPIKDFFPTFIHFVNFAKEVTKELNYPNFHQTPQQIHVLKREEPFFPTQTT